MNNIFSYYLHNKSVAIVGGHDGVNWPKVEACDVVVRINSHWARQGHRCNVLYFSCASDLDYTMFNNQELLNQLEYVWLNKAHTVSVFGSPRFFELTHYLDTKRIPYASYFHAPARSYQLFPALNDEPNHWARVVAEKHNCFPLSGVLAAWHLSCAPIKSLYIDGMTLYQKSDGGLPKKAGAHGVKGNVQILTELLLDPRISASEVLYGCLKHGEY